MFPRTRGFLLLLSLCLAACVEAAPSPTTTAPPLPPEVTEVLPPTATATVPPPTPTATLASPTPTPTPETRCANDSEFLNDLTVPDGAQFLPGQTFVKKWSVRNTGTCDWGPDYRLVLVSGDSMSAPSEVALYPAIGGSPATLEVTLTAPETPGSYTGRWQARDPEGNLFGAVVFVTIEVIPLPATDTPPP